MEVRNITPNTLPTYGGSFSVEAKIYPDDLRGIIHFNLTSSDEPGVCMNYDIPDKPSEWDLIFERQEGFEVLSPIEARTL